MNTDNKKDLIMQLVATLTAMLDSEAQNELNTSANTKDKEIVEMLTIKECTEVASGLSQHTIRQLIAQEKVKFIRTGQGVRGKILVNKESLLDYLNNNCD